MWSTKGKNETKPYEMVPRVRVVLFRFLRFFHLTIPNNPAREHMSKKSFKNAKAKQSKTRQVQSSNMAKSRQTIDQPLVE